MTDLIKALSLVPEIKSAHEEAEKCQRSSHGQALEYAIKAGDALILAKEAVGHGAFSIWRQQNLPHIPQTTASLYMRLAEHKEKFRDSQISNTVATLSAQGKLSLRAAAGLLPKRPRTAAQIAAAKAREEAKAAAKASDEGISKEWMKALEVDELVIVLKQVFDAEYINRLAKALASQARMDPLTVGFILSSDTSWRHVKPSMGDVTTIGLDLAKHVFQAHIPSNGHLKVSGDGRPRHFAFRFVRVTLCLPASNAVRAAIGGSDGAAETHSL